MITYTYPRYLSAKKSVDDRALNQQVWQQMGQWLTTRAQQKPVHILEIGAGIGTMVERLADHHLLIHVHYTGIDWSEDNIATARQRLQGKPHIHFEAIDLASFIAREQGKRHWDLLMAHAFLDLIYVPKQLPALFSLLVPQGSFYFTLNFDGATILQPTIDPILDAHIEALYHGTMDERLIDDELSGDSHSGRHLFGHVQTAGGQVENAGSSDWVVFSQNGQYVADEAYFLHFIVNTIDQALAGHPDLEAEVFQRWIDKRHQQIEAGELVYIAHQLDFWGRIQ